MIQLNLKYLLIAVLSIHTMKSQHTIIPLWEQEIPNSKKSDEVEFYPERDILFIEKIHTPTLEVFLPSERVANGKAVIICPGGGYRGVSYDFEGTDVAKFLNAKGITAFVLKYRMPNSDAVKVSYKAPLQDAQRAIRLVRYRAKQWGINTSDVGIMGFSAGGHLAATLTTHYDEPNDFKSTEIDLVSAKPDFSILIYPVISMNSEFTHMGSRNSLLGKNPSKELIAKFSNELQVDTSTPPTFIVHAADDRAVPVENSLAFYKALIAAEVPVEMHLYPTGGHGFSLAIGKGNLSTWPDRLCDWLQETTKN